MIDKELGIAHSSVCMFGEQLYYYSTEQMHNNQCTALLDPHTHTDRQETNVASRMVE